MMVEIVVGLLAVGALGYAVHWRRERAKWAEIREGQLEKLKLLKEMGER